MFERYTETARRVIFFSRYEASQYGSPHIETEHLLLGILREDKRLANTLFRTGGHTTVEAIRHDIEKHTTIREKVSTSVDLPLSNESKRILAHAAAEAALMNHPHIGPEHILLGILREENSFAAKLLTERGLKLANLRKDLEVQAATYQASQPGRTAVGHAPGRMPNPQALFTTLGRFELTLKVNNIDDSISFYRMLGFQRVRNHEASGAIVLQNGDCRITLQTRDITENRLTFRGGHIPSILENLRASGLRSQFEHDPDPGQPIVLQDPDGNAIHIIVDPTEN
jgi:catechol 2,3-dioxygenase-like lactoylglutathione lyase family enzyme